MLSITMKGLHNHDPSSLHAGFPMGFEDEGLFFPLPKKFSTHPKSPFDNLGEPVSAK
jgi:hypothetical protein